MSRRLRGSVSQRRYIFIADTSSTSGAGLANLTHASSGLVAWYIAGDLSNPVQITLVSATLGTYTSGGFVAVSNSNMPGWYEIGVPDAAFDGGNQVAIQLRGAANMAPVNIYIDLDAVDYQAEAFGALRPTTAGRTLDVSAGGEAGIDLANVGSPTTTLNLSGVTIKTATDIEADTQDIQTRLPAALVDGRIAANAQVVGDKSGYSLTQAFPANFASLGIDGAGAILSVATVEELGVNALLANGLHTEIADEVWAQDAGGTFPDGSFGDRVLISQNNTRALAITGSGHIAAVLHDAEPDSIPEDAFVTSAISARALAADAATEISTAVGLLTALVDLGTMIINDGTGTARYSVSALQNAPSGGGGSIINVYPVSASTPERVAGTTLTFYRDENRSVSVVTDFVLDALELEFVVEDSEGTDIQVIADGSIARSDKTFTVTIGTTVTATISNYRWALRDVTGSGNSVIARGVLSVQEAASNG